LDKTKLTTVSEIVAERIPYRDSLQRIAAAAVLVVLLHGQGSGADMQYEREWWALTVPTKIYEYLRIGRPILALVDEGAVSELLRETRRGTTIRPLDIEGIAEALRDIYADWCRRDRRSPSTSINEQIQRYNRQNLSARLAEQLEVVLQETKAIAR